MKSGFSLLAMALLATTAIAAPARGGIARRLARRQGHPMIPANVQVDGGALTPNSTIDHIQYSQNWAGAAYSAPPSGTTFTAVSATFTVPTPSPTSSNEGSYSAAAWVGIDGDTCESAILQTGVDFTVTVGRNGAQSTSYDAWYEWYPNPSVDFSGFSFTAGDVIVASVVSSSSSGGTATLENTSTGKSVSTTISAPDSSATLCGTNAEWIVEDYEEGGGFVPLANWGTVTFTGAEAKTASGSSENAAGAEVFDIATESGKVLTSVTVDGSSVAVEYL